MFIQFVPIKLDRVTSYEAKTVLSRLNNQLVFPGGHFYYKETNCCSFSDICVGIRVTRTDWFRCRYTRWVCSLFVKRPLLKGTLKDLLRNKLYKCSCFDFSLICPWPNFFVHSCVLPLSSIMKSNLVNQMQNASLLSSQ